MANTNAFQSFWQDKVVPVSKKIGDFFCSAGHIFKVAGSFVFRLRKIFMAVPVVLAAMRMAQYAQENLPQTVGIGLLESGEYSQMVSRETAILVPFFVTLACLVLMFCSRRTFYPWLISIFSLVLPLLIIVSNVFPA